jgi:hypothetical protein
MRRLFAICSLISLLLLVALGVLRIRVAFNGGEYWLWLLDQNSGYGLYATPFPWRSRTKASSRVSRVRRSWATRFRLAAVAAVGFRSFHHVHVIFLFKNYFDPAGGHPRPQSLGRDCQLLTHLAGLGCHPAMTFE